MTKTSSTKSLTVFTAPLTSAQATKLKASLPTWGFVWIEKPYTLFAAEKTKLQVSVYTKGPKILVQGKGTEDFVRFHLEPEILGQARLGYEEVHAPEMFTPHFGIDESGKGDFFGPLVVAGVYVDPSIARELLKLGVQDSKKITSDTKIRTLAKAIREVPGLAHNVVLIGPEAYNRLYTKIKNLNRLLGWGHARVIENLLALRPDCPRSLSDQFANPSVIKNALLDKGKAIQLEQRTKAESDLAVAAASILAREKFIDWLKNSSARYGVETPFPRGVSAAVKKLAKELVKKHGPEVITKVAKSHFKTAQEVIAP